MFSTTLGDIPPGSYVIEVRHVRMWDQGQNDEPYSLLPSKVFSTTLRDISPGSYVIEVRHVRMQDQG